MRKSQISRWCITFTDGITDRINSTVKYICKYANRNIHSVYTERIIEGIIMGFKNGKSYGDMVFLSTEWSMELTYWHYNSIGNVVDNI
jgi:hypothetical protein